MSFDVRRVNDHPRPFSELDPQSEHLLQKPCASREPVRTLEVHPQHVVVLTAPFSRARRRARQRDLTDGYALFRALLIRILLATPTAPRYLPCVALAERDRSHARRICPCLPFPAPPLSHVSALKWVPHAELLYQVSLRSCVGLYLNARDAFQVLGTWKPIIIPKHCFPAICIHVRCCQISPRPSHYLPHASQHTLAPFS